MKKKMVTALLAVSMLAGLSAVNVMAADDDTITVGFSQVGNLLSQRITDMN